MATRTFDIEINGISQSVNAVDSLIDKLNDLEERLQSISGKGIDTGDIKQSLTSIRKDLEKNVDGWEDIADRIDDATKSVATLERQYKSMQTPFKGSEVREYNQEIKDMTSNLKGAAQAADRIDNLGDFNAGVKNAGKSVKDLTNDLKQAKSAEDQLGTKLTVNLEGMNLEFDDVNQAIGVLEDKLYQLSNAGQRGSKTFNDITKTVANLKLQVKQVDDVVDQTLGGGIAKLVKGVGSLASIASVGEGISSLFGIENKSIDETIQKFAALSLVLQGYQSLQQELANSTTSTAQAFNVLSKTADGVLGFFGKFPLFDTIGKSVTKLNNTLKAAKLTYQMDEFITMALLADQAHEEWRSFIHDLSKIDIDLAEEIEFTSLRDEFEKFGNIEPILKQLEFEDLNDEQLEKFNQALNKLKSSINQDAVEAGKLREQLKELKVHFWGLHKPLSKSKKALLALTTGIKAVGFAIKGLLKATIILGLLQAAMEGLSWILEGVGKLWNKWAGDDSLINQMDATTNSINAANKALETFNDNLTKLENTKQISTQTRLNESIKEYTRALIKAVQTQNELFKGEALDEYLKSWQNLTIGFGGADTLDEFKAKYNELSKAVKQNEDVGKNWFTQVFWFTEGDARSDLAKFQKALIDDLLYRLNNIDLSKGTAELEGFIKLLDSEMYAEAVANLSKLYPDGKGDALAASLNQIRDYYKTIQDLKNEAVVNGIQIQDQITSNNIAAIRDRQQKEREELENGYKLELRDAADNEALKASITRKYNTQRVQLLKKQADELRSIQDSIQANNIEAMEDGLAKELAQLDLQRKQELDAARDSEILVGEQEAAINAKYDKLVLEAKTRFYEDKKKLLKDYSETYKRMAQEIAQMEYDIAVSRITGRSKDQMAALGFDEETIDNIREYYQKIRDIQNTEAQKLAEVERNAAKAENVNAVKEENKRNADRLEQLKEYLNKGLITRDEYSKLYIEEVDKHYQMASALYRKGQQDLTDIEKDAEETRKNNNAAALNETISAIDEAYSNIDTRIQVKQSTGIIDFKATKDSLKGALSQYKDVMNQIGKERDNLQKAFDKKEISFNDFRLAKKELDGLEEDVKESSKETKNELDNLITNTIQSVTQLVGQYVNVLGGLWSTYNDIQMMQIEAEQKRLDEEYDMLEEAYNKQEELTQKHTDKLVDIEDELKTSRGDRRAHLIEQLNAERAAMLQSLQEEQKIEKQKEQNEKKQQALEKKRNEQEKKNKIVTATINAYTAMTNALAVQPWFVGLALSAVALAMGLAQVAMIKKQKYAKGGLLKGNSHQLGGIPVGNTGIEVEGNEYVVNKKSTQKNLPLIDYINSSNKRLTRDDLIRFYDSGKQNVTKSTQSKFATGGMLPNISNPNQPNQLVITDDRPVVVQVVDIVNSADNYRQVQVLAGLEGSKAI